MCNKPKKNNEIQLKPDLIAFTETKLKSELDIISIDNYE